MKMIAIGAVAVFAAGAATGTPQTKRSLAGTARANPPVTRAAPWTPKAYIDAANLGPGYSGLDGWRVYQVLKSKEDRVKKDEFETTQEYQARLANSGVLMTPLNSNDDYAFQFKPKVTYDADNQVFVLGEQYGGECKAKDYNSENRTYLCEVASHRENRPNYIGQNAYGASATIHNIKGTDISVVVDRDELPKSLFKRESYDTNYKIFTSIPVPREQAPYFRGKTIAILMVGKITSPILVQGRTLNKEATISDPYDMLILSYGVSFKPGRYIIYIVETGHVLATIPANS